MTDAATSTEAPNLESMEAATAVLEAPEAPDVDIRDQNPELAELRREVLAGLSAEPKSIHPKFLYDERGSELFDRITETADYYPTRTELSILRRHGSEMAEHLGPSCLVVEPGAGSATKIRVLLEHLDEPVAFVPVDISLEHLRKSAAELSAEVPGLEILPLAADYTADYELPQPSLPARRTVVFFPGSTIGNFPREEAMRFLRHLAEVAGPGGALLVGADLVKDRDTLLRAYDDSEGVTAQFTLNLLHRFNRELCADFDVDAFRHLALWNADEERIEIYLESQRAQTAHVGCRSIEFAAGERVLAEYSNKFTRGSFARMAEAAGCQVEHVWTDDRDWFSVQLLTPA